MSSEISQRFQIHICVTWIIHEKRLTIIYVRYLIYIQHIYTCEMFDSHVYMCAMREIYMSHISHICEISHIHICVTWIIHEKRPTGPEHTYIYIYVCHIHIYICDTIHTYIHVWEISHTYIYIYIYMCAYMTGSTEIATPSKPTKSRTSHLSESRGTNSSWDFTLIWICTE